MCCYLPIVLASIFMAMVAAGLDILFPGKARANKGRHQGSV